MRIAIAVWQSRVSPVFDSAGQLLILDVENGREVYRTEQSILGLSLQERVNRLVELDIDVLLCGAISRPLAGMASASGIRVIPWLKGDVNQMLCLFLNGKPINSRFLMPGLGRHRSRFRGSHRKGSARYLGNHLEGSS